MYDVYENNVKTANFLEWDKVPEYCFGDKTAKYVVHLYRIGEFVFVNAWEGPVIKL